MADEVYNLNTECEDDSRRFDYERLTQRKAAEGTRVYREDGSWVQFRLWLMEMRHIFHGDLIPFEWVAQFVGVTRAALHKRVRSGQLTVFTFGIEETTYRLLGGTRKRLREEFKYAVLTECHFWRSKRLDEKYAEEDALEAQAREKARKRKQ